MTDESELTECRAHVARLESELLNLRQQHARDQKESLEHVKRVCKERDEARAESDKLLESANLMLDALEKRRADDDKALCLWCGAITLRADIASHVKDCDKNPLIAELATARAQLLQSDRDIATAIERARVAELAASGWSVRAKHLRESGELGKPFSANTVDWSELARLAYQDAKGLLEASGSTALVGREYMAGLLQCIADALHWMHGNVNLATYLENKHNAALTEQVGILNAKCEEALAKLKESEEFHAGAPSLTEYGHLCDGIASYRAWAGMPSRDYNQPLEYACHEWEREHGKRLVSSES